MLKFALKNMAVHRARVVLVALSIVLSACVALLSFNIAQQVNEGIVSTAAYYDLIIGPSGSATQLAMNTLFFTDEPLGTLDYAYVEEIENSGLANAVVPFTMGDSFGSAKIVGTTADFLAGKSLASGEMFSATYEAVVGSAVARQYGLNVGDEIVTSHGLTGTGIEHEAAPLTVTGILQATGTAYDNVVFTHFETVWAVHSQGHADEAGEETHAEGEICAILVKSKSFNDYYRLLDAYGENASLLCINPSTVLREVLEQVDTSSKIVYALCAVVLLMNIVVVSVITLLNMYDAQKEIALMRLIGISMRRIADEGNALQCISGRFPAGLAVQTPFAGPDGQSRCLHGHCAQCMAHLSARMGHCRRGLCAERATYHGANLRYGPQRWFNCIKMLL